MSSIGHIYGLASSWHNLPAARMIIQASNVSIFFTGLKKATEYSVQVATVAASGVRIQSKIVNCSTLEDLPEAPSDVKAIGASHESAVIAWLPPIITNWPANTLHSLCERCQIGYCQEIPSLREEKLLFLCTALVEATTSG